MKNIFKIASLGAVLSASLLLGSCKKSFLENKPTTQVVEEDVFKTTQGARSALNGIHATMYESGDPHTFGFPAISLMSDFMSGDMGMNRQGSGWYVGAYWFQDSGGANTGGYIWGFFYRIIQNANNIINRIDAAKGTQADRDEIKGQALAYRAFAYFELANYYQFPYLNNYYAVSNGTRRAAYTGGSEATLDKALGVPLYTQVSQTPGPRASLRETYARITNDLDSALFYITASGNTRSDKSQIDINVVHGIYARVSLYMKNYTAAVQHATLARAGYNLASQEEIKSGFNNVNSGEWIWGSAINAEATNGHSSFIAQMDMSLDSYASFQDRDINVAFFNPIPGFYLPMAADDYRRAWGKVDTILISGRTKVYATQRKFRAKFPGSFECDFPLIRVAEMYLIQAEALAQSNQVAASKVVMEEFMKSRQPSYVAPTANDANTIVQEIWKNKRIELWGEGHGIFEAKRRMTPFANGVISDQSISYGYGRYLFAAQTATVPANSAQLVFKIPGNESQINKELIQN